MSRGRRSSNGRISWFDSAAASRGASEPAARAIQSRATWVARESLMLSGTARSPSRVATRSITRCAVRRHGVRHQRGVLRNARRDRTRSACRAPARAIPLAASRSSWIRKAVTGRPAVATRSMSFMSRSSDAASNDSSQPALSAIRPISARARSSITLGRVGLADDDVGLGQPQEPLVQRQVGVGRQAGYRGVEHRNRHLAVAPVQGLQRHLVRELRVRHRLPRGLGRCG